MESLMIFRITMGNARDERHATRDFT